MSPRLWLVWAGLLLVPLGVSGLEWQVDSTTSLEVSNEPSTPSIFSEELLGSLTVPVDQHGGGLEVKAHTTAAVPASLSADFDLLAFTFAYVKPTDELKLLKWSLGRVTLSEPTGLILNHPGDGFKLDLDYGDLNLSIGTGYTGFVSRVSSEISLTRADELHASDYFASPRLVGFLTGSMKVFDTQKFSLSALAQKDLNKASDLVSANTETQSNTNGGTLDTQYITFKAEGPVIERLFYEGFVTLGTGSTLSWVSDTGSLTGYSYQYRPIVSFLLGGSVSYFMPAWLDSSYTARLLVASGDRAAQSNVEGNVSNLSTLFTPITPTTLGLTFNPGLTNLVYYELGGTVKPVPGQSLVTGAKVLGFQRAVAGVVNASGVVSGGPVWMGEEVDLTAGWPVYSDLNATAGAGFFFPSAGTFVAGTAGSSFQYSLSIGATLSL